MSVFGREWECFSRVNASVAASGLLARRQHLVACIRPRERVDVPFSWHTVRVRVPLPVNLLRATRTFFHLAIFTRLTRFLLVVYTGVCIVVSDVNRCLTSTHTNRASRCPIHLSSRTNWMAIVQVSLSIPLWHFVPEQLRSLFSMNYIWRNICQLDEEYRACSMPWHKRQISTIVFWPFHRFFSQLSTRGLFLPAIPVDVHLLFAEVSHSPLRSGIVHTRTCAACSPHASVYVQVRASVSRIRGCVSDRVIDTRANTHTLTHAHTHTHYHGVHSCGQTLYDSGSETCMGRHAHVYHARVYSTAWIRAVQRSTRRESTSVRVCDELRASATSRPYCESG